PVVVPLSAPEPVPFQQAHLAVAGLLVRSPAAAIPQRDPVVHTVEAHFPPGELRPEPYRLRRDAPAVEVAPADEDPGLAVARGPVDVEEPGEPDGLVLVRDRPGDAVLILAVPLVPLRRRLVSEVTHAIAPEAGRLGHLHPAGEL